MTTERYKSIQNKWEKLPVKSTLAGLQFIIVKIVYHQSVIPLLLLVFS